MGASTMITKYWVEVVEYETDEVVSRVGPEISERQAERLERGMNINLNHDRFFTRIDEVEDDQ